MSRPRWLDTPRPAHPWLARIAYLAVVFGPSSLSVALLAGWGAVTGADLPLLWAFLGFLALRQVTVGVVTLLYHRGMSHRTVTLHPTLEYALRIWGWLAMAIGTRTWSVTHRVHHAHADTERDVHSPLMAGESLWTVPRQSVEAVIRVRDDAALVRRLGADLPDDRLERFIEWDCKRNFGLTGARSPIVVTLLTSVWLATGLSPFVALGAALCSLPGINLSVFASTAFLVNGVAHCWGYRNYEGLDNSTNLLAVDVFGLGEALHNNHHAAPGDANLAHRPGEVDLGFALARLLQRVGLVRDLKTRSREAR